MDIASAITTILIAITALLAGWFKCVNDIPVRSSSLYQIPIIGSYLSRISKPGWAFATAIVILTIVNLRATRLSDNKMNLRLQELSNATLRIEDTTGKLEGKTTELMSSLHYNSTSLRNILDETIVQAVNNQRIGQIGFAFLTEDISPLKGPSSPIEITISDGLTGRNVFKLSVEEGYGLAVDRYLDREKVYLHPYGDAYPKKEYFKNLEVTHSFAYGFVLDSVAMLDPVYRPNINKVFFLNEDLEKKGWRYERIGDFFNHSIYISSETPVNFDTAFMTINNEYYIKLEIPENKSIINDKYSAGSINFISNIVAIKK